MKAQPSVFAHRLTDLGADSLCGSGAELFPYWSFTKTALAVCALRLAQDGRLDLEADLAGYDFSTRQLLNHTSGLPDYFTLAAYRTAVAHGDPPWPAEALRDATLAQGRLFAPGRGWSYSNLGYLLVRELIEAVAQAPLSDLIRQMISAPLGLASVELAQTTPDFARLHWGKAQSYHPGWVYHGCLIGTAADAARLLHALLTGKLLNADMLAQMLDHYPLGGAIEGRPWSECGYGLGLMSGRGGAVGRMIGHSGGGPFSVNAVYHFPDRKIPVTVAAFSDGETEGVAEFAAVELALRE